MSIESAKSFIERMKTDEDFNEQVCEYKDNESRMKFVKEAGFEFTSEEIEKIKMMISDEELDFVVGGSGKKGYCRASRDQNGRTTYYPN